MLYQVWDCLQPTSKIVSYVVYVRVACSLPQMTLHLLMMDRVVQRPLNRRNKTRHGKCPFVCLCSIYYITVMRPVYCVKTKLFKSLLQFLAAFLQQVFCRLKQLCCVMRTIKIHLKVKVKVWTLVIQGEHLYGKPGNVREFHICQ